MNNRQKKILDTVRTVLEASPLIKAVGFWPDDVETVAQYPACLIVDGDETDYQQYPAFNVSYMYNLAIIAISRKVKGQRIQDALELQNHIQTIIVKNEELLAKAGCASISMQSVDKGNIIGTPMQDSLGYSAELTIRRLNFTFKVNDNAVMPI